MITTKLSLRWVNETPGEFKWLTLGELCKIADTARDDGLDEDLFVYARPEWDDNQRLGRIDEVVLDPDGGRIK